jgi:hypothetical protein
MDAKILAYAESSYSNGKLNVNYDQASHVQIQVNLVDKAAAQDFVAQFPKSIGWKASTCTDGRTTWGTAGVTVQLSKDGVNGGVNETGIKRYKRAIVLLEKAGVEIIEADYNPRSNQFPSRAAFEATI